MYGSAARNPIHVLAKILADLHDENGRVTLPGFYDGVPRALARAARRSGNRSTSTSRRFFERDRPVRFPAGEKGCSVLEQIWARPTAEVNGIVGGYTGEGAKTVIPAKASAKVSFRLVGDQDPEAIRADFRAFVEARAAGRLQGDVPDRMAATGRSASRATAPGCRRRSGRFRRNGAGEAVLIAMGGSIPIVTQFKRILGMDRVLVGFGLDDDRIHSPNEKYNLTSFHGGIRSWARVLDAIGEAG